MNEEVIQEYGTSLLRVSLGVMLIAHGLLKVLVFTIPGTVGFFESLGLPGFLAYPTIAAELGGGLALIIGAYVREVSLALIPMLLGSIIFAHAEAGWLFSNEGGGWEFPAFWAVALLVQAMIGPGAYAVSRKTLLPIR